MELTQNPPPSTLLQSEGASMAPRRKRLYLDVCTYCRPYDDQSLLPIRIETDAYYLIVDNVERGRYEVVFSPVHFAEVADIRDARQRVELQRLMERFRGGLVYSIAQIRARAEDLFLKKFGVADAAHVAFAEATADVFITCDLDLIRRCRKCSVLVEVVSPVEFVGSEGLR
jgi:predicted nucleic acid-binding protein